MKTLLDIYLYLTREVGPVLVPASIAVTTLLFFKERQTQKELHKTQEALIRDGMTGIYNTHGFKQKTITAIEAIRKNGSNEKLAILYFDLDGFKQLNDTHGHATGDRALIYFAGAI